MKGLSRSNIILLVAALAIGGGAGAGVRLLRKPHKPAATAPAKTAAHDTSSRPHAAADTAKVTTPIAPAAASTPDTTRHASAAADTTRAVVVRADSATIARRERLAKMFAGMEPRDAAHVLEQMTDDDIVAVLGAVRERQAAAILAQLQPKRAASVTRSLLTGMGGRT